MITKISGKEYDLRLVALDVDGTLLNSKHELGPFSFEVLNELHERGLKITLATGKNLPATQAFIEQLGLEEPLIFSNGCVIQYADGRIAHNYHLERACVETTLQVCEKFKADWMLYYPMEAVVAEMNFNASIVLDYGGPTPRVCSAWRDLENALDSVTKIIIIDRENPAFLNEIEKDLVFKLDGRAYTCHTLVPMLEVQPLGKTKASGLEIVTDMLGITMQNTIAFGDGNNDAPMLSAAGFGAAVANATALAKASADIVIGTNDECGPARFLAQLFMP